MTDCNCPSETVDWSGQVIESVLHEPDCALSANNGVTPFTGQTVVLIKEAMVSKGIFRGCKLEVVRDDDGFGLKVTVPPDDERGEVTHTWRDEEALLEYLEALAKAAAS